ncbi:MAG: bifunctional adenosylcobinamide kinase/adenosylcobinamide-phosphate guanylyltransferase [Pseudomonadota bacterium]
MSKIHLILGGARSGKSRYALDQARDLPEPHIFIATAQAFDVEMEERIARHRAERNARWHTVEAPIDLSPAISDCSHGTVLIDCCTLWLSNIILAELDMEASIDSLLKTLDMSKAHIILVSNEVGSGIVPETPLGRRFRDEQGRLNQRLAALSDRVDLVVAGLPVRLKG